MARRIRPLALCLIRRGDAILAFEGRDSVKGEVFYRPLGGEIDFGESGAQAAAREIQEEIGAELADLRFKGALENIFVYEGEPGHEIALVYEADLKDPAFYSRESWTGLEQGPHGLVEMDVLWKPLADFRNGSDRLYPVGVLDLI